ncbi:MULTISPECIES: hypothetical protein [Catenuloplanes]|uniref:PH domain-containing protein n=1 Tax=Catenuloplanes niger TaxID=587534 RepID=A0AAE3ZTE6_9ACTN|nr:hypothetical protein [Catenuloplanes niger]MDR7325522.1 hypothetical protein [Catenuloplanes niger]
MAGALVAPPRLLHSGIVLIITSSAVTSSLISARPDPASGCWADRVLLAVCVALLTVSVVWFAVPRPRLTMDAERITLHQVFPLPVTRVRWSELDAGEPVRTGGGRHTMALQLPDRLVPVPAHLLDVDPDFLARVMSELAAAADRRAFIDSRLSTV